MISRKLIKPAICLLAVLLFGVTPVGAGTINVDDDNITCLSFSGQPDPYAVVYCGIQNAILDAVSGDEIIVANGTYTEQLVIDKDLTLTGAGKDVTVIQSPTSLTQFFTTSGDNYPIVYIHDTASVTIEGLTVDGLGLGNSNARFIGIGFWNAGGSVTDVRLTGVRETPFSGAQHGVSIYAYNDTGGPYTISVSGVAIDDMQKTGIALGGEGLTGTVSDTTVIGNGPTTVTAQNGIQLGYGTTGSITNCEVSGMWYTGTGNWSASGILLYYYLAPVSGVTLSNNTVTGCQGGLNAYFADNLVMNNNTFDQNDFNYIWGGDGSTIDNNTFTNSAEGLYIADATNFTATDNTFATNGTAVIIDGLAATISFIGNSITNSTSAAVAVIPYESDEPTGVVFNNNNISGNAFGIDNATANTVDALNNWWGDASGPSGFGPGTGDAVSDNVDYDPWSSAPISRVFIDDNVNGALDEGEASFYHIQDAVDAANPGDTVVALTGSFEEQVVIDKDLTLTGAGIGATTIQSPISLTQFFTTGTNNNYPIVYIHNEARVVIEDLTVDGAGRGNSNYRFEGIAFWNAGGAVTNVRLTGVRDTPFSGAQHGVSIYAYNNTGGPYSIDISDVAIDDIQKNGMALSGTGLTATVSDSTVTGYGPTDITAQNGIQIGFGAAGSITGCEVSGTNYTPSSWSASGLLLYDPASGMTVSNNNVHNCGVGLFAQNADSLTINNNNVFNQNVSNYIIGGSGAVVDNNTFSNTTEGLWIADATNLTATGNTFDDNDMAVIIDGLAATLSFTGNSITDSTTAAVTVMPYGSDEPTGVVFNYNTIAGNAFGIDNSTTNTVDALKNWWGDATGADHTSNPHGTGQGGDAVSDTVDFKPWYATGTTSAATENVTVTHESSVIALSDTIQGGIDAAVDGDTIDVAAGTYTESILIEKSVNVFGATAGVNKNGYTVPPNYAWNDTVESIINHPNPSGGYAAIVDIHDVDNVTFDGFVVEELNAVGNLNTSLIRVYAHTREISNINVVNNVIGPNTNMTAQDGAQGRMGLYIVNHPYDDKGVVNSRFAGNKIFDCKGNGDNVFLWTSYYAYGAPGPASMAGTMIEDNEIYGAHRSGIETAGGFSNLTIRNNRIYGNSGLPGDNPNFLKYGHGIQLIRGSSDKVSDPLTAYGPVNLTIADNDIYGNEKNGIYMGPKNDSITFTGNTIHNNGWDGIMLDLEGNYWNPTFENPPLSEQYACYDCSNDVVASYNAIYDNGTADNPIADYGVQVKGEPTNGFIFDAQYNWWGYGSGPYDGAGVNEVFPCTEDPTTAINANGEGNAVSDNVDYCPWQLYPDVDTDGDGVCNPYAIGPDCTGTDNCPLVFNQDQADTYPPGGNGIGDACECEADFTCDGDVDADDVTAFLYDFGRERTYNPCTNDRFCYGDFDCDVDVDADDVTKFLEDFGREPSFKACPPCTQGARGWCTYPNSQGRCV